VEYELRRLANERQTQIRFDKDARERYLAFACRRRRNGAAISANLVRP
jgi:sigma54-dependent transcription regulator